MMWMVTSKHRRRWSRPSASIPMNRTRRIFRIGSGALAWTSLGPFGASWKGFGKWVAEPWFLLHRRRRRRWARSWKLGRDWAQVCSLWRHARYGIAGQLARHGGMIRLGFWSHNRWRIPALLAHLIYKLAQILEFIFLKRIRSVKFSVKASTIYKCMFTFISAVIVSDCKRLVMLAKDCSKAATTWAWKTIQPIK